jgi:hypothetical protein
MVFVKDDPRINRNGRPIGSRSFTTKVREALEKIAEGKDYTYEEAFIKAILKKSIVDQDVGMMRTIWEQLDGKPLTRIGNPDGSNIVLNSNISYEQALAIIGTRKTSNTGDSTERTDSVCRVCEEELSSELVA